ncbi:MAG: SRPBCC family protein [Alphaproteobacteria bacterium]|nr:SRPBCC family protein [Alphaproteobacteria bacterium]
MSVSIHVDTVIACDRTQLFHRLLDVERDPDWTSGLLRARRLDEGPLAVGSRVERVSKFLGREMVYTIEITGLEEGERVDMVTTAGPFPMTVTYTLSDADGGTRMAITTAGDPKGFYKLTGPLLSGAVRRQIALDLSLLKDLMES